MRPPKISLKHNWMKELGSEVAGGAEDFQQNQPKTKNPIVRTGRPVLAEQPSSSGSNAQEIDKRVLLDCEGINVRTGRHVSSCVPVSVERLDQDKDADENVDANHVRTCRPVESEQSIGLFTQREEIDIDFRVSGLPHAVVKQAENFRVRKLVKKIESHPYRQALQADLQQNNAYKPFSNNSKAMIREMGNVELFELCETFPKVQCSQCLLYWNQGTVHCTCGHLLKESEVSPHFHQWRLELSQSRTTSSRRGVLVVLGTAKLRHRKSTSWPTMREGDVSKKNFDGIHDRFQRDSVYRDSQLTVGWTEEKCIEMDKVAQENHSYCPSCEEYERYKKNWYTSLNKSGRNAPTKLRSDFREVLTSMHRDNRESGEERPEPTPLYQDQRWHSSSSSCSTSRWQWNENWWSS